MNTIAVGAANGQSAPDTPADADDGVFVSLLELLRAGLWSTGILATAIEKVGIQGWDRYGRFVHAKSNEERRTALDLLADFVSWRREAQARDGFQCYEFSDYPGGDMLRYWGWSAQDLPDFSVMPSSPLDDAGPVRATSGETKRRASLGILAAAFARAAGMPEKRHQRVAWATEQVELLGATLGADTVRDLLNELDEIGRGARGWA